MPAASTAASRAGTRLAPTAVLSAGRWQRATLAPAMLVTSESSRPWAATQSTAAAEPEQSCSTRATLFLLWPPATVSEMKSSTESSMPASFWYRV